MNAGTQDSLGNAPLPGAPPLTLGNLFFFAMFGFILGAIIMFLLNMMLFKSRPSAVNKIFGRLQILSAGFMGLMMLAAGLGSAIELACSGRQAVEVMAALSSLIEGKFGED